MKYLILIYSNPASREIWAGMSATEQAEGVRDTYSALNADLTGSGELIASAALADPEQAKRVQVRDGDTIATDGPFAEVKEHLAGVYLLECEDMRRAVEIAARVPEAALGLVEVRPTRTYDGL